MGLSSESFLNEYRFVTKPTWVGPMRLSESRKTIKATEATLITTISKPIIYLPKSNARVSLLIFLRYLSTCLLGGMILGLRKGVRYFYRTFIGGEAVWMSLKLSRRGTVCGISMLGGRFPARPSRRYCRRPVRRPRQGTSSGGGKYSPLRYGVRVGKLLGRRLQGGPGGIGPGPLSQRTAACADTHRPCGARG